MSFDPSFASEAVALVLAAGRSTRMGSRNKLLLEWNPGVSVVRQVVVNAKDAGVGRIIVVIGHDSDQVRAALEGLGCSFVENPRHAEGLASSLKAGFREAVELGAKGALVLLGDMPLVGPGIIRTVMKTAACEPGSMVQPVAEGRPAHPVWLPKRLLSAIEAMEGDGGVRALHSAEDRPVVRVEVPKAAAVDLDTEDDYRAMLASRS